MLFRPFKTRSPWISPSIPILVTLIAIMMAVGSGCGGRKTRDEGGTDRSGQDVELRGVISTRGSTPFPIVLLQTEDGSAYVLESSARVDELQALEGMEVFVFGTILPEVGGQTPFVRVEDYELLELPSGERPIVGVIRIRTPTPEAENRVWLMDDRGETWVIGGDFEMVLGNFEGAKIWVVGIRGESVNSGTVLYRRLIVTEYGIIKR